MTALLPRLLRTLPGLLALLLLLAAAGPARATHLLGGEMTYKYLDANGPTAAPYRYEITVSVYVACASQFTFDYVDVNFYNKGTGLNIPITSVNAGSTNTSISSSSTGSLRITQSSIGTCTSITVPPGCTITGASQPYQLQKITGIVCLPASTAGYYVLTAPSGARNVGITNLASGNSSGYYLGLYTTLAPPVYANHSPVFVGDAVGLICANDLTTVLNNAVDADGDRLEYSFGQPYSFAGTNASTSAPATFTPPPTYVPYTTPGGYSAATPLGTGAGYSATIDPSTGITQYGGGPTVGNRYTVAVDVKEYRTVNGTEILLGTTRRDIQLIVGTCPPTTAPVFPSSTTLPRNYTVEAGSTLSIPVTATQSGGNPLTLTATSVLLDGATGYSATFAGNAGTPTYTGSPVGSVTVTSTTGGTVSGTLVYTPACAEARTQPYDVTITVVDKGCAGKTTADVLHITVTKPSGPTAIAGPAQVCGLGTPQSYTSSGGTAPGVSWRIYPKTGGTFASASTASPVQITWTAAGTYTLRARGVSQYGCLTDSVSQTVVVAPAPTLTVTGSQAICQGASTSLTPAGGTAPYTLTDGTTTQTGAGPFTVSPTQTTTYTLTSTATGGACPGTTTVVVTVNPLPAANVGATPRSTCSGVPITLGAAAMAGNTYQWSPATGLSSATVANPTLTLPNTTGAATTTYTLTETTTATGCTATNSVTVTVNPAVIVLVGVNQTTCSGVPTSLGGNPVAGYTYSWSPTTGLSSATVANPTVTLTNTTGAATTTIYTLTTTDAASGCTGTGTVTVTVNPAVTAQPGAAVAICSGGTGQLGAAPVAGYTYSWSPTTGLSSATVANPTVTLTNTTGAATTTTYTLTTTNPATGCVGTGTVAVTVNPAVAVAAGSAVTFCSGSSAQLGAAPVAGYTYSWSPATGLSSATVANPTVTLTNTSGAATTTTYTLTATGAGGCQSAGTVAVTVNPAVTAATGAAKTTCSGVAVSIGAAPVAGLTYSWSPATGLSSATVANPTVTLTNTSGAATTTTYTLTTTSVATGCAGMSTVVVTVNPAVTAQPGAAATICSGVAGQLGAAPVTGLAYSWTPATGLSSATAANPTVTLTNTTGAAITQTYTLTTTNPATGCSGTGTVVVTVNPAVVALPGAATTICSGGSAQLGAAPVAGLAYSWSPAAGLSSATVANPTVTLTNNTSTATTQTYTLTTTNPATGCVGTGTVAVTVSPTGVAAAGAAVTICSGLTGQLGAVPVAGLTYSWSPATGLSSATAANPTVTLTNTTGAATTQTYTLNTVSTAGCLAVGTVTVTVNPAVTALPGAAVTICSGLTGQLGAAPVAGYSYQWSPATGLSSSTVANPTVTLTNTTGAATTQTYTLTTTSAAGCVSTGTVVVTVNPAITALPGAAVTICSGLTGQLGATPVAGYTYQWSPGTGLSSATVANPTVTLTNTSGAATTQTYTLTTTDPATGCLGTGTVVVTVNPAVTAQPGVAVTICSGLTGQLGDAPVTGYTYSWSPATGLSSATAANPTVTLTNTTGAATTQTYTLTTTSAAGCIGTGTVLVTVNPAVAAIPGAAVTICSGLTGQLGDAPVAGFTYQWSPATGLSSATAANPTVTLTNTTGAATTQTYTLTTTSAAGCIGTGTVVVTVNPAVTAQPGAAVTICSGLTGQLGDAPVAGQTYSWSPATGLSSATAANPTVTLTNTSGAATTQTYTLTTTSADGCIGTGTVAVTVNPAVTALPGAAVTICSGLTGQLGDAPVAGLAYSWSPATGLSSATAANPTVTLTNTTGAATTQTYTLTTTSTAGCIGTGTVVVTVNPAITALPGAAVTTCSGVAAQLGAAPVAGLAYSWSPTTGLSSATAANPTVTLTNTTGATTTQTYTLTTTDPATGCLGTGTVVVTVEPAVTALPGAAVTICSGLTGQLGAAPVAGLAYSWTPATGLSSATAANPTVTLTNTSGAATTQTYTLTTTSTAGCIGTGTVAVTVNPAVTALPGAAVTTCSGVAAQLGATPVAGYTYQWSPATGLSSATSANPTVTLTNTSGAATTQTYTLTTTDPATGCLGTGTVVVTVDPAVTALPGAAVTICSGLTGQLGAAPVAGLAYSWTPATGLSSATVANPTVTLTNTTGAATTTTYTLTTTNPATGCLATSTVVVTVEPAVTAQPGAAVTICSGSSAQLGAAPVAGYTYQWSPATGLSSATAANPTVTLTNTSGANTIRTYTLTATSAAGCIGMGTVAVTVYPAVSGGSVGTDQTVCDGNTPAPLTSTSSASGGDGTFAYQWESSPDNLTWTAVPNATGTTYAPGPVTATVYYRRRVAAGACGVFYSNTVTLLLQVRPTTTVTLATPAPQCPDLAYTFTPVVANAGPTPTYQWFVNGTAVATTPTFTSATLLNGDQVRVEVTATVGFCASGSAQATIIYSVIPPTPAPTVVVATSTQLPACAGAPVRFSITSTSPLGASSQYQWQVDGADVPGATAATFTTTTLRDGQLVSLLLTTSTTCTPVTGTSNAVPVSIVPVVDVEAGPDQSITEGDEVVLQGSANGTYPVTWTPAAGLTFSGPGQQAQLHPRAAPLTTTTYTLSAGSGSCTDASSVTVTVLPRIGIPSAFSPNGDGRDDTWEIDQIGAYTVNKVVVFNRWGAKVFERAGYDRSSEWNGTANGQPVPVGTYYFVITLSSGKAYTGPLTVIY